MENVFFLQIGFEASVQNAPFERREDAERELNELQAALRVERFSRNAPVVHRVKAQTGDIVVVIDKITSACITDQAEMNRMLAFGKSLKLEDEIARSRALLAVEKEFK